MYMYYFLGHMLEDNTELSESQKEIRAQKTFLLALDGDVDFQPGKFDAPKGILVTKSSLSF